MTRSGIVVSCIYLLVVDLTLLFGGIKLWLFPTRSRITSNRIPMECINLRPMLDHWCVLMAHMVSWSGLDLIRV